MRPHSALSPTHVYVNLNSKGDGHHSIIKEPKELKFENGDLNPQFKLVSANSQSSIKMGATSAREKLGAGRPAKEADSSITKISAGDSVDILDKLGQD